MSSLIQCISEKYFFSKEGVVLRSFCSTTLGCASRLEMDTQVDVCLGNIHLLARWFTSHYVIVTITEKNLNIVNILALCNVLSSIWLLNVQCVYSYRIHSVACGYLSCLYFPFIFRILLLKSLKVSNLLYLVLQQPEKVILMTWWRHRLSLGRSEHPSLYPKHRRVTTGRLNIIGALLSSKSLHW